MSSTRLTKSQWDSIHQTLNGVALPKAGFVRSMPHPVLFGPKKYQGMGLMHFWYLQELTHLGDLVHQVHKDSNCGKRYQITTEQLRLETGFPGPITSVPYAAMGPSVTDSLIKTLWSSCQSLG